MTEILNRNLDISGLNKDTPALATSLQTFQDANNVRFENGAVEKIKGHKEIFSGYSGGPTNPTFTFYWPNPNTAYYLVADANDVYLVDVNKNVRKINKSGTTYSSSGKWTATVLNGGDTVILNNGVDTPQYITDVARVSGSSFTTLLADLPGIANYTIPANAGTNTTELTSGSFTVKVGIIKSFRNFLVAGNIVETATDGTEIRNLRSTIRTSAIAAPGTIPQNWNPFAKGVDNEDEFELADTSEIKNMVELNGNLLIYTTGSIWGLRDTGRQDVPIAVAPITKAYGTFNNNSVQEFDGNHFVIGGDDIYIHNGNPTTIKSIAEGRVKEYFWNNLHTVTANNTFTLRNVENEEIWICFPNLTSTDGTINEALIWNYRTNRWTKRDLPNVVSGTFGPIEGGGIAQSEITFEGTGTAARVDIQNLTITDEDITPRTVARTNNVSASMNIALPSDFNVTANTPEVQKISYDGLRSNKFIVGVSEDEILTVSIDPAATTGSGFDTSLVTDASTLAINKPYTVKVNLPASLTNTVSDATYLSISDSTGGTNTRIISGNLSPSRSVGTIEQLKSFWEEISSGSYTSNLRVEGNKLVFDYLNDDSIANLVNFFSSDGYRIKVGGDHVIINTNNSNIEIFNNESTASVAFDPDIEDTVYSNLIPRTNWNANLDSAGILIQFCNEIAALNPAITYDGTTTLGPDNRSYTNILDSDGEIMVLAAPIFENFELVRSDSNQIMGDEAYWTAKITGESKFKVNSVNTVTGSISFKDLPSHGFTIEYNIDPTVSPLVGANGQSVQIETGEAPIRFAKVNMGTNLNIHQSIDIKNNNSNLVSSISLSATDGVLVNESGITTTNIVEDPSGNEIGTFTSSVTDTANSDLTAVLNEAKTIIDNGTESPIDFKCEIDTVNKQLIITGQSIGNSGGTFKITTNNNGQTIDAGNITFGTAVVTPAQIAYKKWNFTSTPGNTIPGSIVNLLNQTFTSEANRTQAYTDIATGIKAALPDTTTSVVNDVLKLDLNWEDNLALTFSITENPETVTQVTGYFGDLDQSLTNVTITDPENGIGLNNTYNNYSPAVLQITNQTEANVKTDIDTYFNSISNPLITQTTDHKVQEYTFTPGTGSDDVGLITITRGDTTTSTQNLPSNVNTAELVAYYLGLNSNITHTTYSGNVITVTFAEVAGDATIALTTPTRATGQTLVAGTVTSTDAHHYLFTYQTNKLLPSAWLISANDDIHTATITQSGKAVNDSVNINIGSTVYNVDLANLTAAQAATAVNTEINTDGRFDSKIVNSTELKVFALNLTINAPIFTLSNITNNNINITISNEIMVTNSERPWNINEINKGRNFLVMIKPDQSIYAMDLGYTFAGVNYISFIEKEKLSLATLDQTNILEGKTIKDLDVIYPQLEAENPINITIDVSNIPGSITNFNDVNNYSKDFDATKEYKLDTRASGRYLSYRLADIDNDKVWKLTGLDLDVTVEGDR